MKMRFASPMFLMFAAVFICSLPIRGAAAKPAAKPNFVFFLVDDFGWGALGSTGFDKHETPNIDKLVGRGMAFSDGYAACTVCSPSRAAIMTGAYPGRINLTDWIPGHRGGQPKLKIPTWTMKMDHERVVLPEAMKEAGYKTIFLGKWHLMPLGDEQKKHFPTDHGFDINIGGREWGQPKGPGKYFHPFGMPNVTSEEGDYITDRLTDYAVDFIEENKSAPFFLYFSYYTVHGPIMGKADLVKKYQEKGLQGRAAAYAAMHQSLDESVGRVLAELETAGIADTTYVIFTGDNGPDKNEYAGGLKGIKAQAHEGGVREVFTISGPGIKAGSTSSIPVIGTDFYPTILELAGLSPKPDQHQDGVSLAPILKEGKDIAKRSLYWHYPHYHRTKPYGAVRNGDWKLIEYFEDGRLELYNLNDDQSETKNLAAAMPEKAAQLLNQLRGWRKEVGAQMPTPNPNYDPTRATKKKRKKKQPSK